MNKLARAERGQEKGPVAAPAWQLQKLVLNNEKTTARGGAVSTRGKVEMTIRINRLEIEWTGDGAVARAEGFEGVMLTCPRCQALLPRGEEHRCGDRVAPPVRKRKPSGKTNKI